MSHSVSQSVCLSTSLSLRQAALDRQSRDSRTDRQAVSESMILPACAYAVTRIVSESVTQNVAICCMLGKVQDRTGQEKTGKHNTLHVIASVLNLEFEGWEVTTYRLV